MRTLYPALVILTAAAVTFLTRLAPFALFGRAQRLPGPAAYLGGVLPASIIAVLIVYCLKTISFAACASFAPQLIAAAAVAGLHLWKRNNLLSIGAGTVLYMLLVQRVF